MFGRLSPGFFGHNIDDTTREEAFAKTREVITKLEAMRIDLGLPSSALEIISHAYEGALMSISHAHATEKAKQRCQEQRKRFNSLGPASKSMMLDPATMMRGLADLQAGGAAFDCGCTCGQCDEAPSDPSSQS